MPLNFKLPRVLDQNIQLSPNKKRVSPQAEFTVTSGAAVTRTVEPGEYIEIQTDNTIYVKYGSSPAITTSNFDERVTGGVDRAYIVPDGITTIQFLAKSNDAETLLIRK